MLYPLDEVIKMANKKLGATLRDLRLAKGYTQQQVADMLELKNKSTLGSWEVGKSEPDGYTLLKLCRIYEVKDIYKAFDDSVCDEPLSSAHKRLIAELEKMSPPELMAVEAFMDSLRAVKKSFDDDAPKT